MKIILTVLTVAVVCGAVIKLVQPEPDLTTWHNDQIDIEITHLENKLRESSGYVLFTSPSHVALHPGVPPLAPNDEGTLVWIEASKIDSAVMVFDIVTRNGDTLKAFDVKVMHFIDYQVERVANTKARIVELEAQKK